MPFRLYGLLVLASIAFCASLFTGLDNWGRGDWDQFSFRYETPRVAMLRDGQLPMWNPYINGGNVLLAHPHCPAFSPWYLPTLLFGASLGLRFQVVLFVILGAVGMAALLRRWGVGPAGCFLGGVLLMMNAHFAVHTTEGHLEWCLLGLIPWIVLCLDRAGDDWRCVVLAAALFASALLHGSVYIVVVFAPLLALWSLLETIRRWSWRPVIGCVLTLGLSYLLAAVVLLPRIEFLRANPRETARPEQVSLTMLGKMALSPDQVNLFRELRDVRNPPEAVLDRLLGARDSLDEWHRLDLTLATTSDWTDVRFLGFDHILIIGPPEETGRTLARLNSLPLTKNEWLAIKNPRLERERVELHATLYARLPREGDLKFRVTRGNFGQTELKVVNDDRVVLDAIHNTMLPGDLQNPRTFRISPKVLLGETSTQATDPTAPWYAVDAVLDTDAEWCDVQVVNAPYVFGVKEPAKQRQAGVRPGMSGLVTGLRQPGNQRSSLPVRFYFRLPAGDGLRIATIQGKKGESRLHLFAPTGERLETTSADVTEPGGEKTQEYFLTRELLLEELNPLTEPPLRWQLDTAGMVYDWQEYALYMTWLGLAMFGVGVAVTIRRQWPLIVVGTVAFLIVLAGASPINFWSLCKLLPMYGSLQAPSRFLAVVVFAMAVLGGFGLDRVLRWARTRGGPVWCSGISILVVGVVYAELAVLGNTLFSDIFVCEPLELPSTDNFAQRYAGDDIRCAAMHSAHFPYLMNNSGVLNHYENIAIKRGAILREGEPGYQSEAYLEAGYGTASIASWTMSRVEVAVDIEAPDRVILNQNYFRGWKAIRHDHSGKRERVSVEATTDGLVSAPVDPRDATIEFYYLPSSFVAGAIISGPIWALCLGALAVGYWGCWRQWGLSPAIAADETEESGTPEELRSDLSEKPAKGTSPDVARSTSMSHVALSPRMLLLVVAVLLNGPFVLCHPDWPWVSQPLTRSLAVNAVLFLLPGLPWVWWITSRVKATRVPPLTKFLGAIAFSTSVFLLTLLTFLLLDISPRAGAAWNITWIITNVGLSLHVTHGGGTSKDRRFGITTLHPSVLVGVGLFLVAYVLFFQGATRIVPPMDDHDLETQGTGHSLLDELQMKMLTDRDTIYYFAHPPLAHLYVAGSFLYHGRADALAYYDEAWNRAERASRGEPFGPVVETFYREPDGWMLREPPEDFPHATAYHITGVDGADYLVEPDLPKWGDRMPVREMEVHLLYDHFQRNGELLATRTPNLFFAAMTVALLGAWIARRTSLPWLALLVAVVYATNPEVFVRSSYGGYFAISNFAVIIVLLSTEAWWSNWSAIDAKARKPWWAAPTFRVAFCTCLLAGMFTALANHKLVLLPGAIVVWEVIRPGTRAVTTRAANALFHPINIGFVLGTATFWCYGLSVNAEAFWIEHVRTHLFDRVVHHNPLAYQGYPTATGLWLELWQHTGYLLLPLGLTAMAVLVWRAVHRNLEATDGGCPKEREPLFGLLGVWCIVTAVVFSLIDWRQTKHLMPLMLPLCMAPPRWATGDRRVLIGVGTAMGFLLLWNIAWLQRLAADFHAFSISPAW